MKKAKKVKLKNGNNAIKIEFDFDWDLVKKVKTLPSRRFHSEGKFWTCPITLHSLKKLQEWNFKLGTELTELLRKRVVHKMEPIEGLGGELYDFQKVGVKFFEERNGKALNADCMGSGKTIMSLAWLQKNKNKRPAVIVCPSSVKYNWAKEAKKWLSNPNLYVLESNPKNKKVDLEKYHKTNSNNSPIYILNYDILSNRFETISENKEKEYEYWGWVDHLIDLNPKVLITDEAHYYKNIKANRTKAVLKIGKETPHIIALTGTPIINNPTEMYNAINLIDNSIVGNYFQFAHRYTNAYKDHWGWHFEGAKNTKELHDKLSKTIMIRRTKDEILPELPDKITTILPLQINNRKEYKKAVNNFQEWIKKESKETKLNNAQAMIKTEKLKQLAVKGKMRQAIKWIKDVLNSGEKLVVFCHHHDVVKELKDKFEDKAVKLDGSVNSKEKQQVVDKFQNKDGIRLFIGTKAAQEGITLTAASKVAFLELYWSPEFHRQAMDRLHRIGQENKVNVYYLIAKDTIEEDIADILDKKKEIIDGVVDGKETKKEDLLTELIEIYK